jgi:hypothetical protein
MLAALLAVAVLGPGADPAPVPRESPSVTPEQVRRAVERSLPFLEEEGVAWMADRRCNSCHTVTFQVWAHADAAARGLPVDRQKLGEWTRWSLADSLSDRYWFKLRPRTLRALKEDGIPESVVSRLGPIVDKTYLKEQELLSALGGALPPGDQERYGRRLVRRAALPNNGGGPDTLAQLLLAGAPRPGDGDREGAGAESFAAIRSLLLEWQEPEGHWEAGGQMPNMRRSKAENDEVTTMWSVLALADAGGAGDPAAQARQKALAWLKGGGRAPGVSTEWLLLRMLVERRFGDPGRSAELLARLLDEQRPDGGWGWLRGAGRSDAFATGQVLYALGVAGRDGQDPSVRKAWGYLLAAQAEDGSWGVPTAALSVSADPARVARTDAVYTYWGTAWAAIGLLRTLPGG